MENAEKEINLLKLHGNDEPMVFSASDTKTGMQSTAVASNSDVLYMEHVDAKLNGVTRKIFVKLGSEAKEEKFRDMVKGVKDIGNVEFIKSLRGLALRFDGEA